MTYHASSFDYTNVDNFLDFCKTASLEVDQPAASNMWHDNWSEENYTLPYILFKDNRFKNPKGEFFILKHNDLIIGCSGVYISEFNNQIGILGCRTWVSKDYRNQSLLETTYYLHINNGQLIIIVRSLLLHLMITIKI